MKFFSVVFVALFGIAVGFTVPSVRSGSLISPATTQDNFKLFMAEVDEEKVVPLVSEQIKEAEESFVKEDYVAPTQSNSEPVMINEQGGFSANERTRVGVSRDEDGKSNIWAVFPKENVVDSQVDDNSLTVAGGLIAAAVVVVAGTIALLPNPDTI